MEAHTTNDIFQELDWTYKVVLDVVHGRSKRRP
jgi:hypothetical protein